MDNKLRHALRHWNWLMVVAIAPLMLFPQPERAWLLLTYPLILGIQWWAWGEVLPPTPLNPAILLMAIMTGVSIFVTPSPEDSLGKVAGVQLGIMVFFTVVRHSGTRQGLKAALGLIAFAGMGVALLGLMATNWLASKSAYINALLASFPLHLTGLPGAEKGINVNELAGALLWVVPVVVMVGIALLVDPKWFLSWRGKGKVPRWSFVAWTLLLVGAALLCFAVFILSQSRDGYLALAVTVPILLIMIARGRSRYWIVGLLLLSVISGGVIISHVGLQPILDQLFEGLPAKGSVFSVNSMFGRVEIWSRALSAIKDVPLTGLGMNIFRKSAYLQPLILQDPSFDFAHAHNEVLQAALDLGLPGLVGFLALYVGAIGMLLQVIQGSGAMRLLALGILGGLLAHFLFGIPDAVALGAKPGFLFWWLLGMAYGVYAQTRTVTVAHR